MKLIKKITTISTIVATSITALILIMLLFDIKLFGKFYLDFLLTFATLGIGGFFAINGINMLKKSKILGYVSLGLILASIFLIVLSVWINFDSDLYFNITISLGLLSILFNIIVSSGLSLGKSKLVWQILVYVIVFITDIIATLGVFKVIDLADIIAIFLMLIILSILGVIILRIFSKKIISDIVEEGSGMIKISKEEYLSLLEKAKKYDEMISKSSDN